MVDKKLIEKTKREIEKRFPAFKAIKPEVVEKKILPQKAVYKNLSLEATKETKTLLHFRFVKKIKLADNIKSKQFFIVTTDETGQINENKSV
ncbi:MAG: hypothetical protein N3A65_04905 [candidate division WOR-3 bacterium]|nr:hypothetical protein [candidate division WOR-3 bacterium]